MQQALTRIIALILVGVAVAPALAVRASAADAPPLNTEDRAWLIQALAANYAEIEVAKVGVEKAEDRSVRRFAERLLKEYETRNEGTVALAARYGMDPITVLDPATQYRMTQLEGLDGAAFDAAFVAGEEPMLYSEEWVHRRTARHAGRAPIRQASAAAIEPTHALYERANALTGRHEKDLPDGTPHPDDATAIVFGMNVDIAQVALGKLAVVRAQDERVRDFARYMVDAHSTSLDAFADLARERGLTVLEGPGPIALMIYTALSNVPREDFDLEYTQLQVIFHDNWYKRIEYTAYNGKDEAVKAYTAAAHKVGMSHHDDIYRTVARWRD